MNCLVRQCSKHVQSYNQSFQNFHKRKGRVWSFGTGKEVVGTPSDYRYRIRYERPSSRITNHNHNHHIVVVFIIIIIIMVPPLPPPTRGITSKVAASIASRPPNRMTELFSRMKETCPEHLTAYANCVVQHNQAGDLTRGSCQQEFQNVKECFQNARKMW
jgi:hypothetical protein